MDVEVRHWREDDAEALSRAVEESLEHLRPWMPWISEEPKAPSVRRELIRTWQREQREGSGEFFGIWNDGELAGACGLHRRIGPGGLEIGYWVHPDHVRRGLATQASRELVARAFSDRAVDHVEIHHDRANPASGAIPAKLGFERVDEQPHRPEAPGEEGVRVIWRLTRAAYENGEGPV